MNKLIKILLIIFSVIVLIIGYCYFATIYDLPLPERLRVTVEAILGVEDDITPIWNDKPVIYLYPNEMVDLKVRVEGVDLITTYPQYDNSWEITAYPDGTLVDKKGREYNYLYWEGLSDNFVDLSKGFIVSKGDYIEFLENKLAEIGLTDKEACDFISYWLPKMNEYEYCQVSFQMENYEKQVNLDFSVKPDNELRVFVVFKGLSDFIKIEEQDLSYYNSFERKGFTVVEWGGTFLD